MMLKNNLDSNLFNTPKGERGMTPRGSTIAKFLFASMFICGIIATLLTGCGGSNNPSGPTPAVSDPSTNSIQTVSDTKLLTIKPSNTDVTPQHGTRVLISPATYNVTLAAPYDSEATSAVLELYSPSGALIPHSSVQNTSNSASYQLTWRPNTPTAGTYSWRVVYLYPDGKTMTSEPATLIFE